MSCEKHKSSVQGYTIDELAETIGDLRHDALQNFLECLSGKLYRDSQKDGEAGRVKLAGELECASQTVWDASESIAMAWTISKPYMQG